MSIEPGKRRLGIMGGTFDPIHLGHLVAAEEAYHFFDLDKVLFIPAARPPHKNLENVTNISHRLQMVDLATAANSHFEVLDIETKRQGPSYTVDTIRELSNEYNGTTELFFITGEDAILQIMNWRDPEVLLQFTNFIAVSRYGRPAGEHDHFMAQLPENVREKVYPLEIPLIGVSSTDIRDRIAKGRSIRYLVPDVVEVYIREKNLYLSI